MTSRRATDQMPSAIESIRLFIYGAIFMAMLSVASVVILVIVAPNNPLLIATVLGLTGPITTALLAAGLGGIGKSLDGKVSQLIDSTAQREHLKGFVEGVAVNPSVNLDKPAIASGTVGKILDE